MEFGICVLCRLSGASSVVQGSVNECCMPAFCETEQIGRSAIFSTLSVSDRLVFSPTVLLLSPFLSQMTWRPQYRSSKFRHVFGKAATKEYCYDGVPITRSVHDNQLCAVNPRFLAVITECAGGGAFLVLPIHHVRPAPFSKHHQFHRELQYYGEGEICWDSLTKVLGDGC